MKRTLMIALAMVVAVAATGYAQSAPKPTAVGPAFVDANGDGICDNWPGTGTGTQAKKGNRYGPGDGTGLQGNGPRDGTGYGPGAKSGNCTGTGPKGSQGKRQGPRR